MIKFNPIPNQITPIGQLSANKIDILITPSKLGSPISFYYKIYGEMQDSDDVSDILISEGYISMNDQEYSGWGSDDTYAEDFVLQKLGLVRE